MASVVTSSARPLAINLANKCKKRDFVHVCLPFVCFFASRDKPVYPRIVTTARGGSKGMHGIEWTISVISHSVTGVTTSDK